MKLLYPYISEISINTTYFLGFALNSGKKYKDICALGQTASETRRST